MFRSGFHPSLGPSYRSQCLQLPAAELAEPEVGKKLPISLNEGIMYLQTTF